MTLNDYDRVSARFNWLDYGLKPQRNDYLPEWYLRRSAWLVATRCHRNRPSCDGRSRHGSASDANAQHQTVTIKPSRRGAMILLLPKRTFI